MERVPTSRNPLTAQSTECDEWLDPVGEWEGEAKDFTRFWVEIMKYGGKMKSWVDMSLLRLVMKAGRFVSL